MKLLLAGYYGSGNIGDEAILMALLSELRKEYPSAEITVLSADPAETSRSYKVASVHKRSAFQILKEMKRCEAFILGGGGLLQDATSARSLLYYSFLISLAKFFKKKTILLGQGIGPVQNKSRLRRALKGVDLITVRDDMSLKILKDIGAMPKKLALASDLSFLIGQPDRERGVKILETDGIKKCKTRLIAMALRPPADRELSATYYRSIAIACDQLIKEKDSQIAFLIFKYPDDLDIARRVMRLMKYPAHLLLRRCTPSEMLDAVSAFDGLIGMRLHSLIFSSIARIPSLGLSYDPKVDSFQKSVGAPYIPLSGLEEGALISAFGKFADDLHRKSAVVGQLPVKAQQNIALLNERLRNNRISVLGVEIDNLKFNDAVKKAEEIISSGNPGLVVTPNPEIIMAGQNDLELRGIINNAQISVADGVGLMMAGRILGTRFKQRIAGIDLMLKLVEASKEKGYRIFLFGGAEGVAEKAAEILGAKIAGTFHGYSMNDRIVIDKIKAAKPDILFIGLGSPKQEKWASKHLKELNVPLVMCVGGSLDVIAGRVRRAPLFMRNIGLEWLWRLITEPKRVGRMLVLPQFILKVISSRI